MRPGATSMDSLIADFSRSLARFFKRDELPLQVTGDLADLLGTAEQLCERLREIADKGEKLPKKELKRQLFVVQIMLEQDLPMIFADLVPPLRKLSGENLSEEVE